MGASERGQALPLPRGVVALHVEEGGLGIESIGRAVRLVGDRGPGHTLVAAAPVTERHGVVPGLGSGDQGYPVADVQQHLSAGDTRERGHELLERGQGGLHPLIDRVGVVAGNLPDEHAGPVGVVLLVQLDILEYGSISQASHESVAHEGRDIVEGIAKVLAVAREFELDLKAAIEADDHDLVFGAKSCTQLLPQLVDHPRATGRTGVEVVDEHDQPDRSGSEHRRLGSSPDRRRTGCIDFFIRRTRGSGGRTEVSQLDRLAVLEDADLRAQQIVDRATLAVRRKELDVDQLDLEVLAERAPDNDCEPVGDAAQSANADTSMHR